MDFTRTGVILNTQNYDACVAFYRDLFSLPVMFQEADGDFRLTCFEYGGAYLMVETDGFAKPAGKSIAENATKLRFNVADIDVALKRLQGFGLDAKIERSAWGSTINIHDPDGNRIGIRDEATFVDQVSNR